METEWMEVAEFAAYVVAVIVGLDMIAERWLPCCKSRNATADKPPASPTNIIVENGVYDQFDDTVSEFGEN